MGVAPTGPALVWPIVFDAGCVAGSVNDGPLAAPVPLKVLGRGEYNGGAFSIVLPSPVGAVGCVAPFVPSVFAIPIYVFFLPLTCIC